MICPRCGDDRPETSFRVNQHGNRGGLCRSCRTEQSREWRQANPDKAAAAGLRWRHRHPEKAEEKRKRHRERNPERTRLQQQERTSRSRSRRAGVEVELANRQAIYERDDWICQLCFEPIDPSLTGPHPMSASLDHVISLKDGGPHTPSNLQATHLSCNKSRAHRVNVLMGRAWWLKKKGTS